MSTDPADNSGEMREKAEERLIQQYRDLSPSDLSELLYTECEEQDVSRVFSLLANNKPGEAFMLLNELLETIAEKNAERAMRKWEASARAEAAHDRWLDAA